MADYPTTPPTETMQQHPNKRMSEIEGVAYSLINFKKQQAQHCPPSSTTTTSTTATKKTDEESTTGIVPSTTVALPISSPATSMATNTITNAQDCNINSARGRKPVRLGPRKVSNSSDGEGGEVQKGPNDNTNSNMHTNKSTQITRRVHFKPELVILGGSEHTVITPTDPTEYDVVITRNYTNKVYLGNRRYRKLIHAYQEAYAHCSDDDDNANMKINIAGYVVEAIRKEGNGRFLKEDGDGSGVFRDIGYTRACQKTMQALRVAVDGMFQHQRLQQQQHTHHKRPIHEHSDTNSKSNGRLKKRMKFGPAFRKVSNPVCAPRAEDEQEAEIRRILSSKHLMDEETFHRKLCEVYSRKQQQDASQQSRLPVMTVVAEEGVPSSSSRSVLSMRM